MGVLFRLRQNIINTLISKKLKLVRSMREYVCIDNMSLRDILSAEVCGRSQGGCAGMIVVCEPSK